MRRLVLGLSVVLSVVIGTALAEQPPVSILAPGYRHMVDIDMKPSTGFTRGGIAFIANDPTSGARTVYVWGRLASGDFAPYWSQAWPGAEYVGKRRGASQTFDDILVIRVNGGTTCFDDLSPESASGYSPTTVACSSGWGDFAGGGHHVITAFYATQSSTSESIAAISDRMIVMFEAAGTGLSPTPVLYSLPPAINPPLAIAAGEVNGDGEEDLLVLGQGGEVKVLKANNTFVNSLSYSELQSIVVPGAVDLQVSDLDQSGGLTEADLITVASSEFRVLPNGGGGAPFSLATSRAYALPSGCNTLAIADSLDANDAADAWINNPAIGYVPEFTNDGSGSFVQTGQYYSADQHQIIAKNVEFVATGSIAAGEITIYPMSATKGLGAARCFLVGGGPDLSLSPFIHVFRADGVEVMLINQSPAYGSSLGVRIGRANLDQQFTLLAEDDVLTGPERAPNYGPQVRGFRRGPASLDGISKLNYFAYGTLRYGVGADGGDVDGDGYDEIVTGPGPGAVFGPHIRGWNFDGASLSALSKINAFAYGTLKWGANVTAGAVDDDTYDEILTVPGPGAMFETHVRGFNFDGTVLSSINKINVFAFEPSEYGGFVAAGDVDGDGMAEIASARGSGPSQAADVAGFNYDGVATTALPGFRATPFGTLYGAKLAVGDVAGSESDTTAELVAGAGPDPTADSTVKSYEYSGGSLQSGVSFLGVASGSYGTNVASAHLAF